jgi:flagellar biosynthesis protein FlhB
MTYGGIIAIFIAIWIYRTGVENKTGKVFYWVVGSFVVFLAGSLFATYFNGMIIEMFDTDISSEYDNAGGLNAIDDSSSGIQSGAGGTMIGIIFELLTWVIPFFVIAVLRQLVMLKQSFNFMGLFSGIKEMFVSIKNSFKTSS